MASASSAKTSRHRLGSHHLRNRRLIGVAILTAVEVAW